MKINIFGRSGCARTREVMLRLLQQVTRNNWFDRVELKFHDLGTAEGLAKAAYHQLEGDLPAILVEVDVPGQGISGASRRLTEEWVMSKDIPDFGVIPSRN